MSLKPIILAEDNDSLRRLYTDLLESAGLTVMAVSDGEKAIALLHKVASPQLIILDIMMPRLSGIETCRRMRKMQGQNTCPILFLTALDRPETLLECLLAGGDDYLMKSASVAEIVERVQYWSRRGAFEDIDHRRSRAIAQLEAMVDHMNGSEAERVSLEVSSEQANLDLLADFLAAKDGEFQEEDELLLRFGYLVGLVEGSFPAAGGLTASRKQFLRKLVQMTGFVDRKEIDTLLENYERIVTQSAFCGGWSRGRNDSAAVEVPQQARLQARFGDA